MANFIHHAPVHYLISEYFHGRISENVKLLTASFVTHV